MQSSTRGQILNPPNILTLMRIAAIPVLCLLLFSPERQPCFWAAALFAAASVTDWLDVDSIPFTWVEEVGEMLLACQHLPTAIAVSCQTERSQLGNREKAMNMLEGK